MKGIGSWLIQHSDYYGNKLAMVFKDRRLTYIELNKRVNRLANGLLKIGVRRGDRVAAILLNGNEIFEGLFACAKLGVIFVPINFRLSAEEVNYILSDCGADTLFYSDIFRELAEKASGPLKISRIIQVGGEQGTGRMQYEEVLAESPDNEPGFDIDGEEVHVMMYTSGTTGKPKGAMITHANTQWNAINGVHMLPLLETDITLTVAPLFHIGALSVFTTPLIYKGGATVIHDVFDPVNVLKTVEKEKITCLFMVPAMWLAVSQVPDIGKYDLSSMRFNISGGAPCPIPVLEYFQQKGIPMWEGFGMTETSPIVSILDAENSTRKNGSIGKEVMHVDVRIVNEVEHDVPQGGIGELLVRGPNVTKGYWNKPDATREAIRGDWLHTGDMARRDDEGFLYIVDRKKDMLISGGENVYPAEVEQVLFRHPNIKEVAVIGVPDEKWGESCKAIVVLLDHSQSMTIEDLREFCEGKLARYKMPKFLEVIAELPRTATGKVLKSLLRGKA
jgi:fatty-acyl-CoA synthase